MRGQTVILVGSGQRELAKRVIDEAPVGAVVNVRQPSRSLDQNAKLWAMLSDIARAQPLGRRHTTETWKCLFMQACGHAVHFEAGLSGEPFPVGFRSSRLTKRQMCELIDFIQAWGDEQGVTWSDETRAA
jgi:hypothetical protein